MISPNIKINPKLGLGGGNNQKLKLGLDKLQITTVDKMHMELHEELVMIWISLHGLTPSDVD